MDDSRDMSVYAAVLAHDRARAVLRKRRNLEEASVLVIDESLPRKIDRLGRSAENLLHDVIRTLPSEELLEATALLLDAAKALRTAAIRDTSA